MKSVISHTDKHLSKRNYDNLKKNGVINVVLWVLYFNRENVVFFVCAAQPLAYSHASCQSREEAVAPWKMVTKVIKPNPAAPLTTPSSTASVSVVPIPNEFIGKALGTRQNMSTYSPLSWGAIHYGDNEFGSKNLISTSSKHMVNTMTGRTDIFSMTVTTLNSGLQYSRVKEL